MANSQDIKNMLEEFLSDLKGELYDIRSDAMRDAMVHRASQSTSKPKMGIDLGESSDALLNQLVKIYNSR